MLLPTYPIGYELGPERGQRALLKRITKALERAVAEAEVGTFLHHQGVARICFMLARKMGLGRDTAISLYIAGALHDIGKLAIPQAILLAPRHLTPTEYKLVQEHVSASARIVEPLRALWPDLPTIITQHHERMDGSGYPRGLAGAAIHPGARILAAVDVAHAMLGKRSYRMEVSLDAVLAELRTPGFDQFVVDRIEMHRGEFIQWLESSKTQITAGFR